MERFCILKKLVVFGCITVSFQSIAETFDCKHLGSQVEEIMAVDDGVILFEDRYKITKLNKNLYPIWSKDIREIDPMIWPTHLRIHKVDASDSFFVSFKEGFAKISQVSGAVLWKRIGLDRKFIIFKSGTTAVPDSRGYKFLKSNGNRLRSSSSFCCYENYLEIDSIFFGYNPIGGNPEVTALDASTGQLLWNFRFRERMNNRASYAFESFFEIMGDEIVLVVNTLPIPFSNPPPNPASWILVFDKITGELSRKLELPFPAATKFQINGNIGLLIGDNTDTSMYRLFAIDLKNMTVLWSYENLYPNNWTTRFNHNNVVIAAWKELMALDPVSGQIKWSLPGVKDRWWFVGEIGANNLIRVTEPLDSHQNFSNLEIVNRYDGEIAASYKVPSRRVKGHSIHDKDLYFLSVSENSICRVSVN